MYKQKGRDTSSSNISYDLSLGVGSRVMFDRQSIFISSFNIGWPLSSVVAHRKICSMIFSSKATEQAEAKFYVKPHMSRRSPSDLFISKFPFTVAK